MGMCKMCGDVVASSEMKDGLCLKCSDPNIQKEQARLKAENDAYIEEAKKNRQKNSLNMFVTTEMFLDVPIEKRLGIIAAQRIYGINIVKDFFVGIRDFVGGRVNSLESALEDSNNEIIEDLKTKALDMGGNAVIGVKIEHTYNNANGTILSLFATGTVVKLKTNEDEIR